MMSTPDPQQPSEPRQPSEPQPDPATAQIPQPQAGLSFDKPAPPYDQPTAPTYGPQPAPPYDPLPGQAYDPRTGLPLGPPPTSPYGPYDAPPGNPAGYGPPYPGQPYQGPPHPGWYPPPGYVTYVVRPTNGMAIASLVLGILWIYWVGSIMALIFGYVARQQIAERGELGGGLALAGIILGWIGVGTLVLVLLFLSSVNVPPSPGF
jgi:hypothetical protein